MFKCPASEQFKVEFTSLRYYQSKLNKQLEIDISRPGAGPSGVAVVLVSCTDMYKE